MIICRGGKFGHIHEKTAVPRDVDDALSGGSRRANRRAQAEAHGPEPAGG